MVAADPDAPGILRTILAKLSPIVLETTMAVVKTTSRYGSDLNKSKNPYMVISAVLAPATGIKPIMYPYTVPNSNHNIIIKHLQ